MDTNLGPPAKERPSMKVYLAVLVGVLLVLAFYFVVVHSNSPTTNSGTLTVTNSNDAQVTTNSIQSGVGQMTNDLNGLSDTLGG